MLMANTLRAAVGRRPASCLPARAPAIPGELSTPPPARARDVRPPLGPQTLHRRFMPITSRRGRASSRSPGSRCPSSTPASARSTSHPRRARVVRRVPHGRGPLPRSDRGGACRGVLECDPQSRQAQDNAMGNERGGARDDVFVYRLAADDFLVCVNAANRDKDFAWMTSRDAHMRRDRRRGRRAGPRSPCRPRGGRSWSCWSLRRRVRAAPPLPHCPLRGLDGLPGCAHRVHRRGRVRGLPSGRPGPAPRGRGPRGGRRDDIGPIPGFGARDTLRLEVRNCLYGHELTDEQEPAASRPRLDCEARKPAGSSEPRDCAAPDTDPEVLVGILIDGKRIARDGMQVRRSRARPTAADRQAVSRVTSGPVARKPAGPLPRLRRPRLREARHPAAH